MSELQTDAKPCRWSDIDQNSASKDSRSTIESFDRYSVERLGGADGVLTVLGDKEDYEEPNLDPEVNLILEQRQGNVTRKRRAYRKIACVAAVVILLVTAFVVVPMSGIVGAIAKRAQGEVNNGSNEVLGGGNVPLPTKYDLSVLCSPSYVALRAGYRECKEACSRGTCCLSTEENEKDCFDDYPELCLSYTPCAILDIAKDEYEGSVMMVPAAPTNINELCSPSAQNTRNGRTICQDVCMTGSCCWADGFENCLAQNEDICKGYSLCSGNGGIMSSDDAGITMVGDAGMGTMGSSAGSNSASSPLALAISTSWPPPPDDLTELCSPAGIGEEHESAACLEACAVSMCCAIMPSALHGRSCDEDMCKAYDKCAPAWAAAQQAAGP